MVHEGGIQPQRCIRVRSLRFAGEDPQDDSEDGHRSSVRREVLLPRCARRSPPAPRGFLPGGDRRLVLRRSAGKDELVWAFGGEENVKGELDGEEEGMKRERWWMFAEIARSRLWARSTRRACGSRRWRLIRQSTFLK